MPLQEKIVCFSKWYCIWPPLITWLSWTKGWRSNWVGDGRCAGSRFKHKLRKSFPSLENLSGISGISLVLTILNFAGTWKPHVEAKWTLAPKIHEVHASYFDYKKQSDWSKLDGNISVKCNKMWRHTSSYWCQGCLPVPISIIVQPRLQISTSKLYPFLFIITWRIWSTSHKFSWRWKPYMANSSNVIDRKQHTSGAIQYGLPLNECISAKDVICFI